jgi:hypothetical protein
MIGVGDRMSVLKALSRGFSVATVFADLDFDWSMGWLE